VPAADQSEIKAICFSLLAQVFPVSKGIRLLGVTLSSLAEKSDLGGSQLRLAI
jgi:DNA polymerase-4